MTGTLNCTKCSAELPATAEFFYKVDKNKLRGGLHHWCKECVRSNSKKRYRNSKGWHTENYKRNKERLNLERAARKRETAIDRRAAAPMGCTYLMTDGTAFKIGVTKDTSTLKVRMRQIQCGNPREVRIVCWSGSDFELIMHDEFKDCRLCGEWFEMRPEIHWRFQELASGRDGG